jgi:hypothetical protein
MKKKQAKKTPERSTQYHPIKSATVKASAFYIVFEHIYERLSALDELVPHTVHQSDAWHYCDRK